MLALALCLPQTWERVVAAPSPERHRSRVRQRSATTPMADSGVTEGGAAQSTLGGRRSSSPITSNLGNGTVSLASQRETHLESTGTLKQATEKQQSAASGNNGGVAAMDVEASSNAVQSGSTGRPSAPPPAPAPAPPPVQDQPFIRKAQGTWGTVDSSSDDDNDSDEGFVGSTNAAEEKVPAETDMAEEESAGEAARCRAVPGPGIGANSVAALTEGRHEIEQVASVSVVALDATALPIDAAVALALPTVVLDPSAQVDLGSTLQASPALPPSVAEGTPTVRVLSMPLDLEDWRGRVRRAETAAKLAELALELDHALPREEGWLQPWYKTGSFAEPRLGGGSSLAAAATRVFALDRALRWDVIPRPRRGGTGLPGDLPRAWPFFLQCPLSPLCVRPSLHKGKCKHHRSGVSRVDHPMVVPPPRYPTPSYASYYPSSHGYTATAITPAAAQAPMATSAGASTAAASAYYARTAESSPRALSVTPTVANGWPPAPAQAPVVSAATTSGGAVVAQQYLVQGQHPLAASTASAPPLRAVYSQIHASPVTAPAPAPVAAAPVTPAPLLAVPQLQQLLQPPPTAAKAPAPALGEPYPRAYVQPAVAAASAPAVAAASPPSALNTHTYIASAGVAASREGIYAAQPAAPPGSAAQPNLNVPRQ